MNETMNKVARFTLSETPEVPATSLNMAMLLLLDTLGVAAGAATLDAGRIAKDFAVDFHSAGNAQFSAPLLFDGRRSSLPGAAYALATQIDNLDGHDGYNPTKGHIGCAVVPALFAFSASKPELSGREALTSMAIAYEVAARAGISLHATTTDYHTSGAWNALGVAALGCHLLGGDETSLREALGIAEYHGPRSQMMREIDHPTMLHDGSGMGAMVGVNATLLASRGFCGAPAITVEADDVASYWQDLGSFWTIDNNYIKPYPVCRWAHAAIDATRKLMIENSVALDEIKSVGVRTFFEASRLFSGMPSTTSQAQYSLAFSVATMLRYGFIGPEHVSGAALSDPLTAGIIRCIEVVEDNRHSARFPADRWSDVSIELKDGRYLESGDVHARGGPEAALTESEVIKKFMDFSAPVLGAARADAIVNAVLALQEPNSKFADLAALLSDAPESRLSTHA